MDIRQRRCSLLVCLAALMVLLVAGCNEHTDKIRDIVSDPGHFAGRDVTVAGEVTQRYELPLGLTNVAAYQVSDGTSQIWVLSRAGAPVVGDKVGLKGSVRPVGFARSFGGGLFDLLTSQRGDRREVLLGSVIEEKGRKVQ